MAEITSQLQNNKQNMMVPYRVVTVLSSEVTHVGWLVFVLYAK